MSRFVTICYKSSLSRKMQIFIEKGRWTDKKKQVKQARIMLIFYEIAQEIMFIYKLLSKIFWNRRALCISSCLPDLRTNFEFHCANLVNSLFDKKLNELM